MTETPDFINPEDSTIMSDADFDAFVDKIRESRLRAYYLYMEETKRKQEVRDEKLRTKLAAQVRMLDKEIIRGDKVILALEKRINNIRSLQLELGELDD